MAVWSTICGSLARGDYCALVSIVAAAGSAPRDAGARMAVLGTGRFTGTIGGGALEWKAIADARAAIAKASANQAAPPVRQSQQADPASLPVGSRGPPWRGYRGSFYPS